MPIIGDTLPPEEKRFVIKNLRVMRNVFTQIVISLQR